MLYIKSKILIVEDESIEAMGFEQMLKSTGFDVVGIASTGQDAIEIAGELTPDLILMDIILKGEMDGIEAASQIKELYDIPLIYLTAHPEDSTVKRAKITSPFGYLIKPVNKINLKNTIELAIYKHEMDKKLIEKDRNRSKIEAKLYHMMDNLMEGCQIISPDWRYLYVNDSVARHGKVSKEDLLGHTMMEVYPGIDDTELFEVLRQCMNERTYHQMNNQFTYPDGSIGWHKLIIEPVPEGIFILSLEITDQVKIQEELQKSEKRYRELVETINDVIFIVNKDGFINYISPVIEQISGYSQDSLVGREVSSLVHPDDVEVFQTSLKKTLAGVLDPSEFRIYNKKGEILYVQASGRPYMEDGEVVGLRGVMMDITRRKYAEEKVMKSLLEKDILLKEIQHRVKNNLQIISSILDLQETYITKESAAVDVLRETQTRVMSMSLIHEMLYQSKNLNHINFSKYLPQMVTNINHRYQASNIQYTFDVEEIYLNIETSIPLGLITSELVTNSLQHAFPKEEEGRTNKQEKISITLKNLGDGYQLEVADNGIGIPEDIDFKNVKNTLGLRIVTSLVDQLNGDIELDRSQGTSFVITFNELVYVKRI